jgi:transposase
MARHQLSDEEWACIEDLFPPPAETGRPRKDRRLIVNAIFWIMRTGAPWRDLPAEYGPHQTVFYWFDRWTDDGTLDRILQRLRESHVQSGAIDRELWCIDGTIVRAARCAGGGAKKGIPMSPKTML